MDPIRQYASTPDFFFNNPPQEEADKAAINAVKDYKKPDNQYPTPESAQLVRTRSKAFLEAYKGWMDKRGVEPFPTLKETTKKIRTETYGKNIPVWNNLFSEDKFKQALDRRGLTDSFDKAAKVVGETDALKDEYRKRMFLKDLTGRQDKLAQAQVAASIFKSEDSSDENFIAQAREWVGGENQKIEVAKNAREMALDAFIDGDGVSLMDGMKATREASPAAYNAFSSTYNEFRKGDGPKMLAQARRLVDAAKAEGDRGLFDQKTETPPASPGLIAEFYQQEGGRERFLTILDRVMEKEGGEVDVAWMTKFSKNVARFYEDTVGGLGRDNFQDKVENGPRSLFFPDDPVEKNFKTVKGPRGGRQRKEPKQLTESEKEYFRAVYQVLKDTANIKGAVSEIKGGSKFSQMMLDQGGTVAMMPMIMNPIGMITRQRAQAQIDTEQVMRENPEISEENARKVGEWSSALNVFSERLATGYFLKKFPSVVNAANKISGAGSLGVVAGIRRATVGFAAVAAVEYTQETFQEATIPLTMNLYSALDEEIPYADWSKFKKWDQRRFLAVLPLAILGGAGQAARDQLTSMDLKKTLSVKDDLRMYGRTIEEAEEVAELVKTDPYAALALFKKQEETVSEEERQKIGEEAFNELIVSKLKEDQTEDIPVVYSKDGGFVVDFNDGTQESFDTEIEAGERMEQWYEDESFSKREQIQGSIDHFSEKAEGDNTLEYDRENPITLGQLEREGVETRENLEKAVKVYYQQIGQQAPDVIDLDQHNATGSVTLRDNMAGYAVKLAGRDVTPDTVTEEFSEGFIRWAAQRGDTSLSDVGGMLKEFGEMNGIDLLQGKDVDSDRAIIEAWSKFVRAYAIQSKEAQANMNEDQRKFYSAMRRGMEGKGGMPAKLKAIVDYFMKLLAEVFKVARSIETAKAEGKLDTNLEGLALRALGVNPEAVEQNAEAAAREEIAEDLGVKIPKLKAKRNKRRTFSIGMGEHNINPESRDQALSFLGDVEESFEKWKDLNQEYEDAPSFEDAELDEGRDKDTVLEDLNTSHWELRDKIEDSLRKIFEEVGYDVNSLSSGGSAYWEIRPDIDFEKWGEVFTEEQLDEFADNQIAKIRLSDHSNQSRMHDQADANLTPEAELYDEIEFAFSKLPSVEVIKEVDTPFSIGNTQVTPNDQTRSFPTKDGGVVGPASFAITAFHGTPHKVDKFSLKNIGTGEGAQAYGWGLYFAESEGVARIYQRALAESNWVEVEGQDSDLVEWVKAKKGVHGGSTIKEVRDRVIRNIETVSKYDDLTQDEREWLSSELDYANRILTGDVQMVMKSSANLYTVELKAEPEELLDWDQAPISVRNPDDLESGPIPESAAVKLLGWEEVKTEEEFIEAIEEAEREFAYGGETSLKGLLAEDSEPFSEEKRNWWAGAYVNAASTGQWVYKQLAEGSWASNNVFAGDGKAASEALASMGIKGIRYLDGNSRADGEGSHNYVIFNDADIEIKEENGKPVETGPTFSLSTIEANKAVSETIYLKNQEKFLKAIEDGTIQTDVDISKFDGMDIYLHAPDFAFAGEVTVDGKKIFEGKGGVYYPVLFSDGNYFWASTEDAAKSMVNSLNEVGRRNGGKILMALISSPADKMFSSTTISRGVVDFFNALTNNPRKFGITKASLNKAIVVASRAKTKKGQVLSGKLVQKDGLEVNIEKIKEMLDPRDSAFPVRKQFVQDLAKQISGIYGGKTTEKSSALAGVLLGKDNRHSLSDIKKGKLSPTSILQALGEKFSEEFTKTNLQMETGSVYTVIEFDGEVEAVRTDSHESYPFAVVGKGDGSVKVNVMDRAHNWKDLVTYADDVEFLKDKKVVDTAKKGERVAASRETSVLPPSAGVSMKPLKVSKGDNLAAGPALSFSISPATVSRHSELEAKHNAGTITEEETQEAQEMVDEAAKEAGYDSQVYKGMPLNDWRDGNKIDIINSINGNWAGMFSSDLGVAEGFAKAFRDWTSPSIKTQIIEAYVKIPEAIEVDAKGKAASDFQIDLPKNSKTDRLGIDSKRPNPNYIPLEGEAAKVQEALDADKSVIIRNTADEGDVYIIKHPSQIKSADPFTGVPLDQRFDETRDEISFSVTPTSDPLLDAIDSLFRDSETAKEVGKKMRARVAKIRDRWERSQYLPIDSEDLRKEATTNAVIQLNAIAKVLPVDVRSAVGSPVPLLNMAKQETRDNYIIGKLGKISTALEKSIQKTYREKVRKLINKSTAQTDKATRKKRSKIGDSGHLVAEAAVDAMVKDYQEAQALADAIRQQYADLENPTLKEYDESEGRALAYEIFADYDNADSARLERAIEFLEANYSENRKEWLAKLKERKDTKEERVGDLLKLIGATDFTDFEDISKAEAKSSPTKQFFQELGSFYNLMSFMSEKSKDPKDRKVIEDLTKAFRQARNDYGDSLDERQEFVMAEVGKILGVTKGPNRIARINGKLVSLSKKQSVNVTRLRDKTVTEIKVPKEQVDFILNRESNKAAGIVFDEADIAALEKAWEAFEALPEKVQNRRKFVRFDQVKSSGKRKPLGMLSQLELAKEWLALQQEDAKEKYEKGGWDNQTLIEMQREMLPETMALAKFMQGYLKEMTPEVDAVHREEYGLALADVENYFPLLFNVAGRDEAEISMDGSNISVSARKGSWLKGRVSHAAMPKIANALSVFQAHLASVEFWRTHAPLLREWGGVLKDQKLQHAMQAKMGVEFVKNLNNWLKMIEADGRDQTLVNLVADQFSQKIQGGLALSVLGGRLRTVLVNMTASLNVLFKVPLADLLRGMKPEVFGDLKTLVTSPTFQRRLKEGGTYEATVALRQKMGGGLVATTLRRAGQILMQPINFADTLTNLTTALAYRAKVEQLRKEPGMTEQKAQEEALDYVDEIIAEVAQPTDALSRSLFENKQRGKLGSLLFLFASEARKNTALMGLAARKIVTGKGYQSRTMAAQQLFVGTFIYAGLGYFLKAVVESLFKEDEEDKDFEGRLMARLTDEKAITQALATEHLRGIPLLGEGWSALTASAINASPLEGEKIMVFNTSNNPLMRVATSASRVEKISSAENADEMTDAVLSTIRGVAGVLPETAIFAQTANIAEDGLGLWRNMTGDMISEEGAVKRVSTRVRKIKEEIYSAERDEYKVAKGAQKTMIDDRRKDELSSALRDVFAEIGPDLSEKVIEDLKGTISKGVIEELGRK